MGASAPTIKAYMKWEVVELMGYAYYAEKGFRICVPLVLNDGYDFLAEKNGLFLRVNVKLAGLKDKINPNSWSISKASGAAAKNLKNQCDVFLVYLPQVSHFIEIDGKFLDQGNSKSKRIPKSLLLS